MASEKVAAILRHSTGRRHRLIWVAAFHRSQIAQGWGCRRGKSQVAGSSSRSQVRSRLMERFGIHSGCFGQDSALGWDRYCHSFMTV